MEGEIHLVRFKKLIQFALDCLNPSDSKRSLSMKIFVSVLIAAQISLLVAIISYTFTMEMSLTEASQLGLFLCKYPTSLQKSYFHIFAAGLFIRQCLYIAMLILRRSDASDMMIKLMADRSTEEVDKHELAVSYCKSEIKLVLLFYLNSAVNLLILYIGYVFVVTDYKLPFNLMFLPFENLPFAWTVNYVFQLVAGCAGTISLFVYWPSVLISMNHSCYFADVAIAQVNKLGFILDSEDLPQQQLKVKEAISKIVQSCSDILEWQKQAKDLLKYDFLLEFIMLTLINCLAAFTITSEVFAADVLNLMMSALQLLVYSSMGSRVESRFSQLASSLYDVKWNVMEKRNQKDLQMILLMTQNIQGFHGIFDTVDLDTFRKVMKFSYSLFAVLKTVN